MFRITTRAAFMVYILSTVACNGAENGEPGHGEHQPGGSGGNSGGGPSSDRGGSGGSGGTGTSGSGASGSGGTTQRLPLGAPCVPWGEEQPDFAGYSRGVDISYEYERCEGQICLANHFQGRVGCPYGQAEPDLALPADHERRCRTMDPTTGAITTEAVEVAVTPQLTTRRAEDVVHCSCRCAGPDPNAEYCACPNGMECVELVAALGRDDFAGSYCINAGTAYDGGTVGVFTCDADGTTADTDCGNDRRNP